MGAVAVHDILVEQGEQSRRTTASTSTAACDDSTSSKQQSNLQHDILWRERGGGVDSGQGEWQTAV